MGQLTSCCFANSDKTNDKIMKLNKLFLDFKEVIDELGDNNSNTNNPLEKKLDFENIESCSNEEEQNSIEMLYIEGLPVFLAQNETVISMPPSLKKFSDQYKDSHEEIKKKDIFRIEKEDFQTLSSYIEKLYEFFILFAFNVLEEACNIERRWVFMISDFSPIELFICNYNKIIDIIYLFKADQKTRKDKTKYMQAFFSLLFDKLLAQKSELPKFISYLYELEKCHLSNQIDQNNSKIIDDTKKILQRNIILISKTLTQTYTGDDVSKAKSQNIIESEIQKFINNIDKIVEIVCLPKGIEGYTSCFGKIFLSSKYFSISDIDFSGSNHLYHKEAKILIVIMHELANYIRRFACFSTSININEWTPPTLIPTGHQKLYISEAGLKFEMILFGYPVNKPNLEQAKFLINSTNWGEDIEIFKTKFQSLRCQEGIIDSNIRSRLNFYGKRRWKPKCWRERKIDYKYLGFY